MNILIFATNLNTHLALDERSLCFQKRHLLSLMLPYLCTAKSSVTALRVLFSYSQARRRSYYFFLSNSRSCLKAKQSWPVAYY